MGRHQLEGPHRPVGPTSQRMALTVRPYAGATGPDFILMDDNARPHRARVVEQYLQAETIDRMDWPARSPDISPIEHAWDLLQAAVSARPVQPASLQELGTALMEEWAAVPQRWLTSLNERSREDDASCDPC